MLKFFIDIQGLTLILKAYYKFLNVCKFIKLKNNFNFFDISNKLDD